MTWIEIAPEDRERYGAPERIPYNGGRFGLKQVDALEQEVGWTMEDLTNGLRRVRRDAAGEPVLVDELDEDGNPVLDEHQQPKRTTVRDPRPMAIAVVVWLALWGCGVKVPWDDFDVAQAGVVIHWEDDDQGKAPADQD